MWISERHDTLTLKLDRYWLLLGNFYSYYIITLTFVKCIILHVLAQQSNKAIYRIYFYIMF